MIKRKIIDLVVVNDRGYGSNWKKIGAKKVIALPVSSADISLWRKLKLGKKELKEFACDVCFVGTLIPERQKILLSLRDFNLKIWGRVPLGVKLNSGLKPFFQGPAEAEKANKIFNASKIALNLHTKDMKFGGNLRTFEIPASGTFQLVDRYDDEWFVEGIEIVLFKSSDDLKKKIEFYIKNSDRRISIARNGLERVLKKHTYEKRFKKLFNIIYGKDE